MTIFHKQKCRIISLIDIKDSNLLLLFANFYGKKSQFAPNINLMYKKQWVGI